MLGMKRNRNRLRAFLVIVLVFILLGNSIVSLANTFVPGRVRLVKKDVDIESQRIEGAIFKLQVEKEGVFVDYRNGTLYTTNQNGIIEVTQLPAGHYRFVEVEAAAGYDKDAIYGDLEFSIASNDATFVEVEIYNGKLPPQNQLSIRKISSADSSKGLEGAVFKLYNENGFPYSDQQYVTDQDGYLTIHNLPVGNYYLEEVSAPDGYRISEDGRIDLTVGVDSIDYFPSEVIENEPIGSVQLNKYARDSDEGLNGAIFELYRKVGKDDYELYQADLLTMDGIIYIDSLPFGEYYFIEVQAPMGYHLNKNKHHFSINAINHLSTLNIDLYNEAESTVLKKLLITKSDNKTGKGLGGAEFALYYENGMPLYQHLYTDISGKLEIESLAPGIYYLEEVVPPAGYMRLDDRITIDLTANDMVTYEIDIPNEKEPEIAGVDITIEKVDSNSKETINGAEFELYRKNDDYNFLVQPITSPSAGTMMGTADALEDAWDSDDAAAKSGIIALFRNTVGRIQSLFSGSKKAAFESLGEGYTLVKNFTVDGTYQIEDLIPGLYVLREVKAPDGYTLTEIDYRFEILDDGSITGNGTIMISSSNVITIENDEIPETKEEESSAEESSSEEPSTEESSAEESSSEEPSTEESSAEESSSEEPSTEESSAEESSSEEPSTEESSAEESSSEEPSTEESSAEESSSEEPSTEESSAEESSSEEPSTEESSAEESSSEEPSTEESSAEESSSEEPSTEESSTEESSSEETSSEEPSTEETTSIPGVDIIIKKIDGKTGYEISGAVFKLFRKNDSNLLSRPYTEVLAASVDSEGTSAALEDSSQIDGILEQEHTAAGETRIDDGADSGGGIAAFFKNIFGKIQSLFSRSKKGTSEKFGEDYILLQEFTVNKTYELANLSPGYYVLKEVKAPEGYILEEIEYHFEILEDGSVLGEGTTVIANQNVITIENEEVPETAEESSSEESSTEESSSEEPSSEEPSTEESSSEEPSIEEPSTEESSSEESSSEESTEESSSEESSSEEPSTEESSSEEPSSEEPSTEESSSEEPSSEEPSTEESSSEEPSSEEPSTEESSSEETSSEEPSTEETTSIPGVNIIIKKIDGKTGYEISGAVFKLYRKNDSNLLSRPYTEVLAASVDSEGTSAALEDSSEIDGILEQEYTAAVDARIDDGADSGGGIAAFFKNIFGKIQSLFSRSKKGTSEKFGEDYILLQEFTVNKTYELANLSPGYYVLKEVKAPEGYILEEIEYHFEILEDGSVLGEGTTVIANQNVITIENEEVPETTEESSSEESSTEESSREEPSSEEPSTEESSSEETSIEEPSTEESSSEESSSEESTEESSSEESSSEEPSTEESSSEEPSSEEPSTEESSSEEPSSEEPSSEEPSSEEPSTEESSSEEPSSEEPSTEESSSEEPSSEEPSTEETTSIPGVNIIIKKIDGKTGYEISGAVFKLYRKNDSNLLSRPYTEVIAASVDSEGTSAALEDSSEIGGILEQEHTAAVDARIDDGADSGGGIAAFFRNIFGKIQSLFSSSKKGASEEFGEDYILLQEFTVDKTYELANLSSGYYVIKEVEAPEGYILAEIEYHFEILEDGSVLGEGTTVIANQNVITIENDEVPETAEESTSEEFSTEESSSEESSTEESSSEEFSTEESSSEESSTAESSSEESSTEESSSEEPSTEESSSEEPSTEESSSEEPSTEESSSEESSTEESSNEEPSTEESTANSSKGIIIKKIDSNTKNELKGAVFQLYRKNSDTEIITQPFAEPETSEAIAAEADMIEASEVYETQEELVSMSEINPSDETGLEDEVETELLVKDEDTSVAEDEAMDSTDEEEEELDDGIIAFFKKVIGRMYSIFSRSKKEILASIGEDYTLVKEFTINKSYTFETLTPGFYVLVEKKAPEGYMLEEMEYHFEILDDGSIDGDGMMITYPNIITIENEEIPESSEEPGTEETESGTQETEPGTQETEPGTQETEPGTQETEPGTQETEPGTQETEPGTQETEPGTQETEPGTQETEPGTQETEPGTQETEPGTQETEPDTDVAEPGTEVTESSTGETEPESSTDDIESSIPPTETTVPRTTSGGGGGSDPGPTTGSETTSPESAQPTTAPGETTEPAVSESPFQPTPPPGLIVPDGGIEVPPGPVYEVPEYPGYTFVYDSQEGHYIVIDPMGIPLGFLNQLPVNVPKTGDTSLGVLAVIMLCGSMLAISYTVKRKYQFK